MRAYAITVTGNERSEIGFYRLRKSHEDAGNPFELFQFDATTAYEAHFALDAINVDWTYPWEGVQAIEAEGVPLRLHAYKTRDREARMACFMSHYRLWSKCAELQEPLLILEDDAVFLRRLDPKPLLASPFDAIGINDPRGATRKAALFHEIVQRSKEEILLSPWVDNPEVPQGLAGASAYLIRPAAAHRAIELVARYGAWPNDAILCRQLCPMLGVTRTYYTKVQGTPSSLA